MQVSRRTGLWLVLACSVIAGCSNSDRGFENKAIARAYLENFIVGRQWDRWHEYFSADVTYNGSAFAEIALRATADGLHLAFPDLSLTVADQIAEGDKVVTRVVFSGTHQGLFNTLEPTGRPVRFQGIMIDKFTDGRVVSTWQQIDMWSIVRQLTARTPRASPESTQDGAGK